MRGTAAIHFESRHGVIITIPALLSLAIQKGSLALVRCFVGIDPKTKGFKQDEWCQCRNNNEEKVSAPILAPGDKGR